MKINLDESEIQKALVEYINNQGIDLSQKTVSVTLTAGRGVNGHSAQIEIESAVLESSDSAEESEAQQAIAFNFEEPD